MHKIAILFIGFLLAWSVAEEHRNLFIGGLIGGVLAGHIIRRQIKKSAREAINSNANLNIVNNNNTNNIEADTAIVSVGGGSNDAMMEGFIKLLKTLERARQEFDLTPEQYTDIKDSELKQIKDSKILWNPVTRLLVDPSSKLPLKLLKDVDLLQVINEDPGVGEILKEEVVSNENQAP